MFEEKEKNSLNYTLQKESLKVKKGSHDWSTSPSLKKRSKTSPALFGAVCNLHDSPYRIFRVSQTFLSRTYVFLATKCNLQRILNSSIGLLAKQ